MQGQRALEHARWALEARDTRNWMIDTVYCGPRIGTLYRAYTTSGIEVEVKAKSLSRLIDKAAAA